jgi:hypothetical protein
MRSKLARFLIACSVLATSFIFTTACDNNPTPSSPYGPGLTLSYYHALPGFLGGVILIPESGVEVDSTVVAVFANAQGSRTSLIGITLSNNGSYYCSDCIQPAGWILTDVDGPHCGGQTGPPGPQGSLASNHILTFLCGPETIEVLGFLANPTPFNLQSPSDLNLTGNGIDTTYGSPAVGITDDVGTIIYQGQADAVSPDNQTAYVNAGNMSSLYPGAFYAGVANRISDGSYYAFGGASFQAINSSVPTRPPYCDNLPPGMEVPNECIF